MQDNKTIDYYNQNAEEFIKATVNADMHEHADGFLAAVSEDPAGKKILDFGCGSGRDSKYFIEKGCIVTAIDGSRELCRYASEYIGQPVKCMDFFDLEETDTYDGIWACSSLLHIEATRLPDIIKKMANALVKDGVLYVSFKEGDYSGERNGRYFTDLTAEMLSRLIIGTGCMREIGIWKTEDVRNSHNGDKWVNGLFRKLC